MRAAGALLFGLVLAIAACTDSRPESRLLDAVSNLPWCDEKRDEAYAGPFSASDCRSAYFPANAFATPTTIRTRFIPPAPNAEFGEIVVDRYNPDGSHDANLIVERGLRAFDYPMNERLFFPLQRDTGDPVISVWIGDGGDGFVHAGDLPFGSLFFVDGRFWAVGHEEPAGSWRVDLFEIRDSAIHRLGNFRVSGAGQENCDVSPSPALTEAGLYPDKVGYLCFAFSDEGWMPRAYRDVRRDAAQERPH